MKSKKGSVELIFIVLVWLMVWAGSGKTEAQIATDRADIQKSFGQPKGNVITGVKLYSQMTDAEKAQFDKTSPDSPSFW